MPPEGWHIVIDSSVRPSVRPSVPPSFFVRSITSKLCKASTFFIGRYISLRRSTVHKNHNTTHHTFGVIALCSLSFLNFVRSISQLVFMLLTLNYICRQISLRRSALHMKHLLSSYFWSYCPLFIFILEFCPEQKSSYRIEISQADIYHVKTCTKIQASYIGVIVFCCLSLLNFDRRIFYNNVICFGL